MSRTAVIDGNPTEPISNTPEEFAAQLKREVPQWKKIAQDANIRVE